MHIISTLKTRLTCLISKMNPFSKSQRLTKISASHVEMNSGLQFNDNNPLTPTNKTSIEGFMRSHGRTQPDFVPDAQVVFEPMSSKQAVNLDKTPFYVNMYRKSQYMLNETKTETPLEYGTGINLKDTCPMIYTLIKHILGNKDPETEHFLNWLAYFYQN